MNLLQSIFSSLAHAQAMVAAPAAAPPGAEGCGDPKSGIILMLMIFAIFWLIVFRPQQKRMKEQQRFLDNLQKGQEVSTQGGLVGKITGFQGPSVILEVQEKIRLRVLRSHISAAFPPATRGAQNVTKPKADKDKAKADEDKELAKSDPAKAAKPGKPEGKPDGKNDGDTTSTETQA